MRPPRKQSLCRLKECKKNVLKPKIQILPSNISIHMVRDP